MRYSMPCEKEVRSLLARPNSLGRFLIAGGGAPEIELSQQLGQWAKTLKGLDSYCVSAYAEAFEVIPYTLAENAGLNPIAIVTELRNRHAKGEKSAGINVRKVSRSHIQRVFVRILLSTEEDSHLTFSLNINAKFARLNTEARFHTFE
jgi:hypothetical protein